MKKRDIIIVSFLFLFLISIFLVYAATAQIPANGATNWGDDLRAFLEAGHNDAGVTDAYVDDSIVAADIATDAVAGSELALVNAFVFGSLADGTSGWAPNDAGTFFDVTASAATITTDSVILISLDGSAGDVCTVSDVTAATSFKVQCASAPNDGAVLNYAIFDQG